MNSFSYSNPSYYQQPNGYDTPQGRTHTAPLARPLTGSIWSAKTLLIIGVLMAASHIIPHYLTKSTLLEWFGLAAAPTPSLYLIEKAAPFVEDESAFEEKVRDVASRLNIAPEWLMAVMFSESRFDAAAVNLRGSGATGLIQFMPLTATSELGISTAEIGRLDHEQQMEYVYQYLQRVRERYGDYESLTELYLAILFPKAIESHESCYQLYAKPEKAYQQNIGLDENKDGRVTVQDIDRRMKRMFPTAYIAEQPS